MATAPAKPQPLHNFSLPFLKWGGKNHTNANHRFRRPLSADHASEPDSEPDPRPHKFGSRTSRNRVALSACDKSERAGDGGAGKLHAEEAEAEEVVQKPWNLRPRKPAAFPRGAAEIGAGGSCEAAAGGTSDPKSLRLKGMAEMPERKFWIALSKDEIEEDIFVMTGSRPARRPKKRPKHVQKQLDSVFPGLWLVGATADAYRIPDAPPKR